MEEGPWVLPKLMSVKVEGWPLLPEPCRWGQGSRGQIPLGLAEFAWLAVHRASLPSPPPRREDPVLMNSTDAGPWAAVTTPLCTLQALGSWAGGSKSCLFPG